MSATLTSPDSPSATAARASRPVGIVLTPVESDEAKGVTIHRAIGGDRMVYLDPYLLLDHLNVPAAEGGAGSSVGFPRHPHRGIETLTYVFTGRVHHRDSLGNDGSVGAGGSQWMTAGGGIFHEEMLESGAEGVEALQIWFNLPAAEKMKRPAYAPATAADIPTVDLGGGATARVVSGTVAGKTGPFAGIAVRPTYLDVQVPAGVSVTLPAPNRETAFAYIVKGRAVFGDGGETVAAPHLVVFAEGDAGSDLVRVRAADGEAARFVFVTAARLNEPVLQYRSLVMNTVDQMREALADLENGTFAKE